MPLILAFFRSLVPLLLPFVIKVLVGLGIGFVTYTGVKALIDAAKAQVMSDIGGLTADAINILAITKVDAAITILFSALAVRLALQGMTAAGAFTRWGAKPPPGT